MTTPGEAIIDAVIKAKAVETARAMESGGVLFVWAGNASEQIEAALHDAGWEIRRLPEALETTDQQP